MGARFEGEMTEFKKDTSRRLGDIEVKLDKALDNNRKESAVISGVTGLAVAILGILTGKHS